MRGFLLRRARPTVPRALGASWSPPRATSRTRPRHRRGDEPCGRSLIARPHGVRLGVTMRVYMVRIVRAEMAVPFSGRSGQPRVDSTTTGHRCWSTRGYHAWTKGITVLAAGSKPSANERCRPSHPSSAACDGHADEAMLALVRLLARQAAREVFAQTAMESDQSVEESRE
jgi:hypothetical protein